MRMLLCLFCGVIQASANYNANFVGMGNSQYNSTGTMLNTIGTPLLNGVTMSASTFPKIGTIASSLTIPALSTTGSVNINTSSYGFTAAPLAFIALTNNPGGISLNMYTSGITTTNVTVNGVVTISSGVTVNFSLLVIGY